MMDEQLVNRLWEESNNLRDYPNRRIAFAALVAGECAKVAESIHGGVPCDTVLTNAVAFAIRAKFSKG